MCRVCRVYAVLASLRPIVVCHNRKTRVPGVVTRQFGKVVTMPIRSLAFDAASLQAVVRSAFEVPSSNGTVVLAGDVWLPPKDTEPACVVQLVHGMSEHVGRYDAFARKLASLGCIVAGHDHLGHGRSVPDRANPMSSWGVLEPNAGADHLVEDVQVVRRWLDERFEGLPHAMFGHSMGSFVLRTFLARHGEGLAGAVVSGTGWQPPAALALGRIVTALIGRASGWDTRSRFVNGLVVGAYARAFAGEEGDELAWLTRDVDSREAYRTDPASGFVFSVSAYHELFRLVGMAQDVALVSQVPHGLPVFLISGTDDPVGGMGKAVPKVAALMRSCGLDDVAAKLYPDARHELVNETNRAEVVCDVVNWYALKGIIPKSALAEKGVDA